MGAYGRRKYFPSARFWGFGRILGFLRFRNFGYVLGEEAGLGWAGLAGLAGFSYISSFRRLFSAKDRFCGVCGPWQVWYQAAKSRFFVDSISDLEIYGLDFGILLYLGGVIGIGIPCFVPHRF